VVYPTSALPRCGEGGARGGEKPLSSRRRQFPERVSFGKFRDDAHELAHVLWVARYVVGVYPSAKELAGEDLDEIGEGDDSAFGSGIKAGPVANVFFRPEEVHGASGEGERLEPVGERNCDVARDLFRIGVDDRAVTHLDSNW